MKANPTPIDGLQVTVTLTIGQINAILVNLAEAPLRDVLEPYSLLRQQGDAAVDSFRRTQAQAEPHGATKPQLVPPEQPAPDENAATDTAAAAD